MSFLDGYTPMTRAELDAAIWQILHNRSAAYDTTELDPVTDDGYDYDNQGADAAEARETKAREWQA